MKTHKKYDLPLLFRLWHDATLTNAEISLRLGMSLSQLDRVARANKLGKRQMPPRQYVAHDPTPSEIEARARECRERHFAQRREEDVCNTHSKVSKWRRGICQPGGERHAVS